VVLGIFLLKKEAQMRKLLFIFVVAGLMGFLSSEYAFAEGEKQRGQTYTFDKMVIKRQG
jgi:hypothetical protein